MFYNLKGIFDNWLCQGHERDEKLKKVLDQLNPSCKHCKRKCQKQFMEIFSDC